MNKKRSIFIAIIAVIVIISGVVITNTLSKSDNDKSKEKMMAEEKKEDMKKDKMDKESTPKEEMAKEDKTPMMSYSGMFKSSADHETMGTVSITTNDDGSMTLTFKDFKTTDAPDPYVYLTAADGMTETGMEISKLTSLEGEQSYTLPKDTDLMKYTKVVIWCKEYSNLMGTADLMK